MPVTYVVIPAKDFSYAKQRLTALLQPGERARLARAMLTDTLTACRQARNLNGIGVEYFGKVSCAARAASAGPPSRHLQTEALPPPVCDALTLCASHRHARLILFGR